jgi:Fe2+ transport system protein B
LRWATHKENSNNRDNIRTEEYWRDYKKNKMAEYRANYTEDKKTEVLAKKREAYDNETQKEYVNRPEVKERRLAEQTRKRALIKAFSVLPFAEV